MSAADQASYSILANRIPRNEQRAVDHGYPNSSHRDRTATPTDLLMNWTISPPPSPLATGRNPAPAPSGILAGPTSVRQHPNADRTQPESSVPSMAERDFDRPTHQPIQQSATNDDDWEELGDEEVPTVVLYVIAGLLLIAFSLYLVAGGGHGHFH